MIYNTKIYYDIQYKHNTIHTYTIHTYTVHTYTIQTYTIQTYTMHTYTIQTHAMHAGQRQAKTKPDHARDRGCFENFKTRRETI